MCANGIFYKRLAKKPPPPRAKPVVSPHDRAVLDLKLARDKLKRYQAKLAQESASLLARAQAAHKAGAKTKAVYYMKVKKLKEAKAEQLYGELLSLETMMATVEWATQSAAVVAAMEKAHGALESLQRSLPLERVEALMDDVAEAVALQAEIDNALAGAGAIVVGVGDDELDAELHALEAQQQRTAKAALQPTAVAPPPVAVPVAPAVAPPPPQQATALEELLPVAPNTLILPEAPTTLPVVAPPTASDEERQPVAAA